MFQCMDIQCFVYPFIYSWTLVEYILILSFKFSDTAIVWFKMEKSDKHATYTQVYSPCLPLQVRRPFSHMKTFGEFLHVGDAVTTVLTGPKDSGFVPGRGGHRPCALVGGAHGALLVLKMSSNSGIILLLYFCAFLIKIFTKLCREI